MEVSKERMIELVKHAPKGETKATHVSDTGVYFCGDGLGVASYNEDFSGWMHSSITSKRDLHELRSIIKLDYSVLDDKPVYTKEMQEAGELPPVGCECGVNRDGLVYRVKYSSEYVVIVENVIHKGTIAEGMDVILDFGKHDYKFYALKTDQEKLIDDICECLSRVKPKAGYEGDAINLIQDFNITRKGESNA